jgi:hypothetical protein
MRLAIAIWMVAAALQAARPVPPPDLKQAQAEPNLEKRSKLAVDAAMASLKLAREAYTKGEMDEVGAYLANTLAAVSLSEVALEESGKDPRRSPKWFKRAEMELRELIRRADAFSREMSYTDRPLLEKLHDKVVQVHDRLLTGLMEGKRK